MNKTTDDAPNASGAQKERSKEEIKYLEHIRPVTSRLRKQEKSNDKNNMPSPPPIFPKKPDNAGTSMIPPAPPGKEGGQDKRNKSIGPSGVPPDSNADIKDPIGIRIINGTLRQYLKELEEKNVPLSEIISDATNYGVNSVAGMLEDLWNNGLAGYVTSQSSSSDDQKQQNPSDGFGYADVYAANDGKIPEMPRYIQGAFHTNRFLEKLLEEEKVRSAKHNSDHTQSPQGHSDFFDPDVNFLSKEPLVHFADEYPEEREIRYENINRPRIAAYNKNQEIGGFETIYRQNEEIPVKANPMGTDQKRTLAQRAFDLHKEIRVLLSYYSRTNKDQQQVIQGKIRETLMDLAKLRNEIKKKSPDEQNKIDGEIKALNREYHTRVEKYQKSYSPVAALYLPPHNPLENKYKPNK